MGYIAKLPRALRRIFFFFSKKKDLYVEKGERKGKGKDREESVEKFPSYALPS